MLEREWIITRYNSKDFLKTYQPIDNFLFLFLESKYDEYYFQISNLLPKFSWTFNSESMSYGMNQ